MTRGLDSLTRPLILLMAITMVPVVFFQPYWVSAFVAVALSYRYWISHFGKRMPPRSLMLGMQSLAVGLVWLHFHSIFGEDASAVLLVLLSALKTFELRTKRDYFICSNLAFLVMMTHLLSDQGLTMTAFMLVSSGLMVAYMMALEKGSWSPQEWRQPMISSFMLFFKALPIVVITFLLFPRFSTGFGSSAKPNIGKTGISDSLNPGAVSGLIQSDELVFRATFLNQATPPQSTLYWRAAVLDQSDGLQWKRSAGEKRPVEALHASEDGEVEVVLEPGFDRFLFTLDQVDSLEFVDETQNRKLRRLDGDTYEMSMPLSVRERYRLYQRSAPVATEPELSELPQLDLARWTQVPPLSKEMAEFLLPYRDKSESAVIFGLLSHFKSGKFEYSLSPPQSTSVEDFLFKNKVGFCEHFSATMATLLRHLGIPARVIVGFQGGTPSALGNYVTVRSQDAHAWVEYFDSSSRRWRRLDPTAQVNPTRVFQGSESYFQGQQNSWLAKAYYRSRAVFDEVDASWKSFMLGFDLSWQKSWLAKFGMEGLLFRALPFFLILAVFLILSILYFFESQRKEKLSVGDSLYWGLVRRLKSIGVERIQADTPTSLLEKVKHKRPDLVDPVDAVLEQLVLVRYGGRELDRAKANALKSDIRKLA